MKITAGIHAPIPDEGLRGMCRDVLGGLGEIRWDMVRPMRTEALEITSRWAALGVEQTQHHAEHLTDIARLDGISRQRMTGLEVSIETKTYTSLDIRPVWTSCEEPTELIAAAGIA